MNCIHCNSVHIKKNGHTPKGKQNYFCLQCKHAFVDKPDARLLTLNEQRIANELLLQGKSGRAIAKQIRKGIKATASFIKKSTAAGLV